MHSGRTETIYVTLDVLLDTRLGTIARMGGDALAASVLESGYHTRMSDDFLGVDKDVFKTQYKNRDVATLAHSSVTNAVFMVRHLVGVLAEQAIVRPYHDGVKVVVNYFPYELSVEEREAIGQALVVRLGIQTPPELVFITPENLTPSHCKQTYSLMIVYEFEEWLELHSAAFAHTRLPEVDMYAPALFCKLPTAEELERTTREAAHPVFAMEFYASPLIRLKLLDVRHFCILSPQDHVTPTTVPSEPG